MPLVLRNTLSRRNEAFASMVDGKVGMYACGLTVYNYGHIGNFRTFVAVDVLRRYLQFKGLEVRFVMNITDVDDKIIRESTARGVKIEEFTAPFTQAFFEDSRALGILPATVNPKATDSIPAMIDIIGRLIERGLAYEADGSVWYSISKFADYGKLSGVDMAGMRPGARVAVDEYEKEDVRDFVLWKGAKPEDEACGAVWQTPWGPGRPGWHIECSAMARETLGETFDIHAGGVDLIFPHHEDEIAQSEGASGKPFARTWVHAEHLFSEGQKMSKSIGNVYFPRDLIREGTPASAIRYLLISAHYRTRLNFTMEGLEAARVAVRRVFETVRRLESFPVGTEGAKVNVAASLSSFEAAMDDDLNTPAALAALFGLVKAANTRMDDAAGIHDAERREWLAAFQAMDSVFGFIHLARLEAETTDADLGPWVESRLADRRAARARRDWVESDRIRDVLVAKGIILEDGVDGTKWRKG